MSYKSRITLAHIGVILVSLHTCWAAASSFRQTQVNETEKHRLLPFLLHLAKLCSVFLHKGRFFLCRNKEHEKKAPWGGYSIYEKLHTICFLFYFCHHAFHAQQQAGEMTFNAH